MKRIIILMFIMLFTAAPLMAADKEKTGTADVTNKTSYLDEIITTATRIPHLLKYTPVSVTVLTKERINENKPQDVGDVLEEVSGLKVERYGSMGSLTTVHIRGLYSSHVLVMVDGRPVNEPSLGMADLSWLSVDSIERVEVVRGPGSALYGANAVAGVVNIITKNPPEKMASKVSASYGEWDTQTIGIENGMTIGSLGYLINADYKKSDGHREHSLHRSSDFSGKVSYDFDKLAKLTVSTGYYNGKTELPGTMPSSDIGKRTASQTILGNGNVSSLFDYSKSSRAYLNAALDVDNLKINAYLNNWDDDTHREWMDWGARHVASENLKTTAYGGEIQYSAELYKKNMVTGGINLKKEGFEVDGKDHNTLSGTTLFTKWDADRTTWALFAEDEINIEPVTLVLGARWDNPEDFKAQTSLKASLLWALGENTNLRASYGDSFRAPTLNDLYWPSDPFSNGNPDLEPEKGQTYEVGVEQVFSKNILLRASLFRQNLEKMIAWAPTGPMGLFGNKWQPTNLNKAKINGLEFEGRINCTDDVDILLSYTYLDGEQTNKELVNDITKETAEKTRALSYLPKHKLDLGLSYKDIFRVNGLRLNLDSQYVAKTYQYYQNWNAWPVVTMDAKEMASYWVTDMKLTKEINNAEIFFAVNNLFDEKYAIQFGSSIDDHDYPMPGRGFTAGATLKF